MISNWRSQGYTVKLFYLRLPMVDMAIERVKQRVLVGGHNVPEDVVRRRFEAGLKNFENCINLSWMNGFYTITRVSNRW